MRQLILIALLALTAVSCTETAPPPDPLQQRAERVTIIRDDFGIPHIYAKTDADAVFGMLYAQAEDDFARVERNYIWALGRLAEVAGEEKLFSDLRARLYMTEAEAREAYAKAPPWLQELCIAFAEGLNYYLQTHPDVKPALIHQFEPWMPMYFFEGSIGGDIEQIPLAGIESFYGGEKGSAIARVSQSLKQPADSEPAGSNGFAIAGSLTDSGDAMLLINPHTSFYFRPEIHVVSEEGLNAYGAVTWGQFFVYQGFNDKTGWMHTSTYVDFMDEFIEDVQTRDGKLQYRYGEEWRPVWQQQECLQYTSDQGMQERCFEMYRTHHGPITHSLDGRWVSTKINWDPVNALRQSFLRTKQSDLAGFNEVMQIRTNSSNNTVYADADGNIAYYHGNFIPRRDPSFDYANPVDGSNPATDWQGIHAVEETVHLVNPESGWLQNCNSTPFTAAGSMSPDPADYPRYMAPDPENFRGVHAVRLLEDQAAAERDKLSLNELIALAYHPRLPAFEVLLPPLLSESAPAGLAEVLQILGSWDYTVRLDSVAMSVAHFYGEAVLKDRDRRQFPGRMQWMQHYVESTPVEQQQALLLAVIDELDKVYGTWRTPWGANNRFQRLDGAIDAGFDDEQPSLPVAMASGRWGALAAYGSKRSDTTRNLYGYRGNSFVAVVEFGERLKAKTLLAGGQSGDPNSPHFSDQATRYVGRQFKPAAYYREDVEARAVKTYHPGE